MQVLISVLVEFFCQHPRWALHSPGFVQKAPVSCYMRYDTALNLTVYIITGPDTDQCVQGLQKLVRTGLEGFANNAWSHFPIRYPLDIHFLLSKLFCESSQEHIQQFRQSMFNQVSPRAHSFECVSLLLHLLNHRSAEIRR